MARHYHLSSCYNRKLDCNITPHVHAPRCRDKDGVVICGKTEHSHWDNCYIAGDTLICGK